MSEVHMGLELRLEKREFLPGERLCGSVHWSGLEAHQRVRLYLGWYVGKDDARDAMSHCEEEFRLEEKNGSRSFDVLLPRAPLSFEGGLFSLSWSLEAQLEDAGEVVRVPIVLARRGQ